MGVMDKCDKKEKDYGRWYIDFPRRSITDDATRLGIFFKKKVFFMTFEIQREIIDFLKRWILFHFRFSLNILYIDVIDPSVSRVSRGYV